MQSILLTVTYTVEHFHMYHSHSNSNTSGYFITKAIIYASAVIVWADDEVF